jgi:choloylglycine hydrolase
LELKEYSRGMGAMGLPGDWSSQSRFVRAAFVKENSALGNTETECVAQFFHILDSVAQIKGCCEVERNKYEITIYSSCCNADKGIYYYTTYSNRQITAVNMHLENLDGTDLLCYELIKSQQLRIQN